MEKVFHLKIFTFLEYLADTWLVIANICIS
jgi:hypothetical protein